TKPCRPRICRDRADRSRRRRDPDWRRTNQRTGGEEREDSTIRSDLNCIPPPALFDELSDNLFLERLLINRQHRRGHEERDENKRPPPPRGGADRPRERGCRSATLRKSPGAPRNHRDYSGENETGYCTTCQ